MLAPRLKGRKEAMRRIFFCLMTIIILFILLLVPVFADAGSEPAGEYLTWEYLGTFAGVVAAVVLIVQFLKLPLDKVWKIPTRYIVYVIAALILFAVQAFTGTLTTENIVLTLLNAVVVAMAAMGTYDVTFAKIGK